VFDLNGKKLGSVAPTPPNKLEGPSGIALAGSKLYVLDMASNRVIPINL
jgi:hypothetical protein